MTYNFNWKAKFRDGEGEMLPADSLKRSNYAASLSWHVVRKSLDGDYVLNINASWGHGKTYFLKRWFNDIKENHPSVYVNAWKHDFSQDPLLTVVSELKNQLSDQLSLGQKINEKSRGELTPLLKAMGPLVAKGLTKKLIGLSYEDLDDDYTALVGQASEKIASLALAEHNKQVLAIEGFRAELTKLAESIGKQPKLQKPPIFVFIDELDRCRPTFAIELLEMVKHLFDVKEFVFIIATDTEQLEHSIKAIYGAGFDANRYLARFFTERVRLPANSLSDLLLGNTDFNFLFDYDDERVFKQSKLKVESLAKALSSLFNDYSLSLRTIKKLLSRAALVINSLDEGRWAIDPTFLVLLLAIKESSNDCYSSLMHDIKPSFNEQPHLLTPKKLEKYTVKLIVEPEKLGYFSTNQTESTQVKIKLSEIFSTRRSDLSGTSDFKNREELLRVYGFTG